MKPVSERLPRIVRRVFACLLNHRYPESVLADMEEMFHDTFRRRGRSGASFWCIRQFFLLIFPFVSNTIYWSLTMIHNYLILMLRHLMKQRVHSLIKVLGLAVGLACCLLIFLFVYDEFTFDRFHENIDRIFGVKGILYIGDAMAVVDAQPPLASHMAGMFPEVVDACRMSRERFVFKHGDQIHEEVGIAADPSFFRMFTFPLAEGDGLRALRDENSVILSKGAAERYFAGENPAGRTISIRIGNNHQPFTVSGVTEEIPENSSIQFDFILPLSRVHGDALSDWTSGKNVPTFIQLAEHADPEALAAKFPDSIDEKLLGRFEEKSGYHLHPLGEVHLRSEWGWSVLEKESRLLYSRILMGIAGLILLIAILNFMNISIGTTTGRMKEAGMRKVLGAQRHQLRRQFLLESAGLSLVAMVAALFLAQAFLPVFSQLCQKSLSLRSLLHGWMPLFVLSFAVVAGVIAGWVPASVLVRFELLQMFKGVRSSGKNLLGRFFLLLQFGIMTCLIIATLFVGGQYRYMLQRDCGYEPSRIVALPVGEVLENVGDQGAFFRSFKQALGQQAGIVSVSGGVYSLSRFWMSTYPERTDGSRILIDGNEVDEDFVRTMGIDLIAGRSLSESYAEDLTESVLVNEALVKAFSLEEPVGLMLSDQLVNTTERWRIVGVFRDFHYTSVKDPIRPAFLKLNADEDFDYVFVKIEGVQPVEELRRIRDAYARLLPDVPFRYYFLADHLADQYDLEERWSRIVGYASGLTILVACLGVFGLALLAVERRTKEIGVRKVLGASVSTIVRLIQGEFQWLVLASNIIAWPAAYVAMREFLKTYPYRIPMNLWVFLSASLAALLIASMTIITHALRAARSNPVDTLRYE